MNSKWSDFFPNDNQFDGRSVCKVHDSHTIEFPDIGKWFIYSDTLQEWVPMGDQHEPTRSN